MLKQTKCEYNVYMIRAIFWCLNLQKIVKFFKPENKYDKI